jgi:DNA-binding response OmpR family regulator
MRVLVIDDSEEVTSVWEKLLDRQGYEVRTAASGEAGLVAAILFSPDIICLDLTLPDMSGYELASRLRTEVCTSAPIIAISDSLTDALAEPADIDHFFFQPARLTEVLQHVSSAPLAPRS